MPKYTDNCFIVDLPPIPPHGKDPDVREIPGSQVILPSLSNAEYRESYTYRLSELVFGSLLASYILGFFTAGMNLAATASYSKPLPELLTSPKLALFLEYLLISATFAYLTAAYYVTYHYTILTMPQVPAHRLGVDFGIALAQAVLFGLSMICPDFFIAFFGCSLGIVFLRQRNASQELSEFFHRGSGAPKVDHKVEQERFNRIVKQVSKQRKDCLKGWLPVSLLMWLLSVSMLVIGGFFGLLRLNAGLRVRLLGTNVFGQFLQVALDLGAFIVLCCLTNRVFRMGAKSPFSRNADGNMEIDLAAAEIVEQLKRSQ